MKILSIITAITALGSISSPKTYEPPKKQVQFNVSNIDEDSLETETFKPGEMPFKKPLLIMDLVDSSDNSQKIKVEFNYNKLVEMVEENAKNSGLLTGSTPFEKITKQNLFVDVQSQAGINFNGEVIVKGVENNFNQWKAKGRQMILQDQPVMYFEPLPGVSDIYLKPEVRFEAILFADKKNVKVVKEWGWIDYGSYKNQLTLRDLFRPFPEEEMSVSELETYETAYSEFFNNLMTDYKDNYRVASNTTEIVWANQGSEKQNLFNGYNIKFKFQNEGKKIPFPVDLLLIPLLLIIGPFVYFIIRKVIKK